MSKLMTNGEPSPKKVHLVSLGCPKNLVDSEMMLASLLQNGYQQTDIPDEADTLVVNTCGFIEAAKQESVAKILELAEVKDGKPNKKLVVAGCLTQRYREELVEALPEVDYFVGSGSFQALPEILRSNEKKHFHLPTFLQQDSTPRINSQPRHRAYLKISEGCKKQCSFCAIPMIRGRLQSRSLDAVVSEAQLLVAGGVKELIVISHDFTDYGWDIRKKSDLPSPNSHELLERLAQESGAEWIRVLYLYPDGINEDYLSLISSYPQLLPYFDMPLQHIADPVLKLMNRRMTSEEIRYNLSLIRKRIPDAVIRTQFIVGFPGETDADFEELLKFVADQQFDRVGCFMYSPEENTKAVTLPNHIPDDVKQYRHDALMSVQAEISRIRHQNWVGKTVPVLIEGLSDETDLLGQGRFWGQAPDIDGVVYISSGLIEPGRLVNVRITDAHVYDLVGEIEPSA